MPMPTPKPMPPSLRDGNGTIAPAAHLSHFGPICAENIVIPTALRCHVLFISTGASPDDGAANSTAGQAGGPSSSESPVKRSSGAAPCIIQ
ncbi:hypothetical protein GRF29_19g2183188 [Pseudopithomyces chartarum]|uniref:Uncharacterized protein n=1 Tax=Pseudopithomyces chartarum TaxID=1892770 RepID=A0AAN6M2D8_9PLEO|nr:hypothetical protein GRF29_19g2183188 [Pseudopithomyces chartarum]